MAVMPQDYILKRRLNDSIVFQGINKTGYGGRGVFLKGLDYEPELALLPYFLSKDSVFIDIGANTGIYSMVAASLLTNGTVISFEPFPLMSSYLLKNVVQNRFGNVRLRTFGISNETSGKKFYMNSDIPTSFSFSREVNGATAVELFTMKLDDAVKMENLDRIDYIKIDAEGEELKIVEGALDVIKKFRPIIQLELMYGELRKNNAYKIIDGYRIFSSKEKSDNKLYIPEESDKIKIAQSLGMLEIKEESIPA